MLAKIYRPARNAMQSGLAKTHDWVLEYEPEGGRGLDPLMGWTSSPDTRSQLRLTFETQEEAISYATRKAIPFEVIQPHERKMRIKSYADTLK